MDSRIEVALRLIESDIKRTARPHEIAARVRLSVSRFYDLFRQETGTVPARYVRRLRFERARDLLVTSDLSVKEIACHVGVNDVSHFVRDFQRLYGMSPRRFRSSAVHAPPRPASLLSID